MQNNLSESVKWARATILGYFSGDGLSVMRTEGTNLWKTNFLTEGFTDRYFAKWQARKVPKGKKAQMEDAGRAILLGHENKKHGVHLKDSTSSEINKANLSVVFTNDKPYAGVHNYGLQSGRPPGFTMPKRQFIGPSEVLMDNIVDNWMRDIETLFIK